MSVRSTFIHRMLHHLMPSRFSCALIHPPFSTLWYPRSGMVMDWRHLASRPTVNTFALDPWELLNSVWSGGRQVSSSPDPSSGTSRGGDVPSVKWDGKMDPRRGWIVAFCWLVAAGVECVLRLHLSLCALTSCFLSLLQHHVSLYPYTAASSHTRLRPHASLHTSCPHDLLRLCAPNFAILLACHGCLRCRHGRDG